MAAGRKTTSDIWNSQCKGIRVLAMASPGTLRNWNREARNEPWRKWLFFRMLTY